MQKSLYFENDGQFIAGTLHLPQGGGPCPGVIFCHGFTGNRIEAHFLFVAAARRLVERGIASLRFDFRGSGESEGDFVDMTPSAEVSDARRALDVIARQPEVDASRIGIVGLSLGGLVAACTAGLEPRIRSTVLWSAVANLPKVIDAARTEERNRDLAVQGWVDRGGLKVGRAFFDDMATHRPAADVARSNTALLIIHGAADESVPVEHAESYFEKAQRPGRQVEKLIIDGADHTYSRVDWADTAIDATAHWLAKTL